MEPGGIRQRRLLSPTLPSNQRFEGVFFLSLPVRNERGESRREGPSRGITPPLPGPLLPPASGREGEQAGCPGGYGAQSAHKVRGILSSTRSGGEGARTPGIQTSANDDGLQDVSRAE